MRTVRVFSRTISRATRTSLHCRRAAKSLTTCSLVLPNGGSRIPTVVTIGAIWCVCVCVHIVCVRVYVQNMSGFQKQLHFIHRSTAIYNLHTYIIAHTRIYTHSYSYTCHPHLVLFLITHENLPFWGLSLTESGPCLQDKKIDNTSLMSTRWIIPASKLYILDSRASPPLLVLPYTSTYLVDSPQCQHHCHH